MSFSAPKLCVADVSMTFKTPTGAFHALAPVTLSIPQGRFVSLIGPSGCGKSTIFNIIAGLLEPTGGRVLIDGIDATGTIGRVGYMLQKDRAIRHPRRRGGNLSLRRGPRDGDAAGPHHRDHPRAACSSAHSRERA